MPSTFPDLTECPVMKKQQEGVSIYYHDALVSMANTCGNEWSLEFRAMSLIGKEGVNLLGDGSGSFIKMKALGDDVEKNRLLMVK